MRLSIFLAVVSFTLYTTIGKKCSETSCCAGYHFNASGDCVVCPLGLYGIQCSHPCPKGYYGELCSSKCQCSLERCNASIGCVLEQVCPLGVYGDNCSIPCPQGYYGEMCKDKCSCSLEYCNASTGCPIKYDCPVGYFGENCSTPCLPYFYGDQCRSRCKCSSEYCDSIIGCVDENGAKTISIKNIYIIISVTVGCLCLFTCLFTWSIFMCRKVGRGNTRWISEEPVNLNVLMKSS